MPLRAPNLDDRRFDDLVAEAISRIPRYAPEWTDHNKSDPGITLVQLFAWLGEMLMYRLNRVPERNYIKFLQLIGVNQLPARPAAVDLTFRMVDGFSGNPIVPRAARVSAAPPPPPPGASDLPALPAPQESDPIVFETDQSLVLLPNALAAVMAYDGISYTDVTAANAADIVQPYQPFGPSPKVDSALLIGLQPTQSLPPDALRLRIHVFRSLDSVEPLGCSGGAEPIPPATVAWEYRTATTWKRLDVLSDDTRGFTRTGTLVFRGPRDISGETPYATAPSLYWLRARLLRAEYESAPSLERVLTNTVTATAVQTIRDEALGGSNGEPRQIFQLAHAPVFAAPPIETRNASTGSVSPADQVAADARLREDELRKGFLLEVDETLGPRPWREVPDFFRSGPDDPHYTLDRTTGAVRFGDGEHGRIPLASTNNIIARYYRWGGGARGNVGGGTVTDLQTSVAGVESVTNLYAGHGGADEELLEETKQRAPRELRAQNRAVTPDDFEFLALQTPGVRIRRAHALANYHPRFPSVRVAGAVTVMVIPDTAGDCPRPSESTLQAVCAYLTERRLLTTQLFVAPPRYKIIRVEADILARPTADDARLKTAVEQALKRYLHPLTGGPSGDGWPPGFSVYQSELFRVILGVEGIGTVLGVRVFVDDEPVDFCKDAEIPPDFLVCSGEHGITVSFVEGGAA